MNSLLPAASIAARITFTLLVATSALVLLNQAKSGSVSAPQEQPVEKAKPKERKPSRRLFENRIPEHLPIKVKVKREKEPKFRDLDNDKWARDLELEVKNVGDKPIYTLYFQLHVPDSKIQDSYQSFGLAFGRAALANGEETPTAEDIPIKPGETITLRIEENQLRGWDQARELGLVPAKIRGARLVFQDLTFADGTGFEGLTGSPRRRAPARSENSYFRGQSVDALSVSESPPDLGTLGFASENLRYDGAVSLNRHLSFLQTLLAGRMLLQA